MPLYSQYGLIEFDENQRITQLKEKPIIEDHWMNAGFIVFEKEVFDHWDGTNMEQHVFPKLVEKNLVYSFPHKGFFKSLDSYKDQIEFAEIASSKPYPWTVD